MLVVAVEKKRFVAVHFFKRMKEYFHTLPAAYLTSLSDLFQG